MDFKKFLSIEGRATRREYWYFVWFAMALLILAKVLANSLNMPFIFTFVFLFIILPLSIPISVRRLHDIGKSGWWYLATFIPIIGPILWLIWFFRDSQHGENKYGPDPILVNNNIQES